MWTHFLKSVVVLPPIVLLILIMNIMHSYDDDSDHQHDAQTPVSGAHWWPWKWAKSWDCSHKSASGLKFEDLQKMNELYKMIEIWCDVWRAERPHGPQVRRYPHVFMFRCVNIRKHLISFYFARGKFWGASSIESRKEISGKGNRKQLADCHRLLKKVIYDWRQ